MSAKLVFNIEVAGTSEVSAMNRHEVLREQDGPSAIDPLRRHLNEVLHGPADGPSAALRHLYDEEGAGVKRPDDRAEKPFLRIVVGASPEFFRGEGQGPGEWMPDRVEQFKASSMEWLREKFGDDLLYVSLHLDEDTPHMHVLVAPTITKKPRKPGRQRRKETDEQFAARKAAAVNAKGFRQVSRSSHPELSKRASFDILRRSLADHLEPLGIEYGEVRAPTDDKPTTTRQWVKRQAEAVAVEREALAADRQKFEADRQRLNQLILSKKADAEKSAAEIIGGARVQAAEIVASANAERQRVASAFRAMFSELEAGTLRLENDRIIGRDVGQLRPGGEALAGTARMIIAERSFNQKLRDDLRAALDEVATFSRKIKTFIDKLTPQRKREASDLISETGAMRMKLREMSRNPAQDSRVKIRDIEPIARPSDDDFSGPR